MHTYRFNLGMHIYALLHWSSLNRCMHANITPGRYPWKLKIIVVGTPATVIAANFQVLCQVAALLISKHRKFLTQHIYSENSFSQWKQSVRWLDAVKIVMSKPCLSTHPIRVLCIHWENANCSEWHLCWTSGFLCLLQSMAATCHRTQKLVGITIVEVPTAAIFSFHRDPTGMPHA